MALNRLKKSETTTSTEETTTTLTPEEQKIADLKAQIAAMEAEAGAEKVADPEPKKEEKVVATIPKQEAGDLATSTGPVMPTLMKLKDAMDPEVYGNIFPRIKGSNGGLNTDAGTFGTFIDAQVHSWSKRVFITPVAPDGDKQARKYCRASYDGKTIPGRNDIPRMTIEDYTESVADKYEEFKRSDYLDIYVTIFNAEKGQEIADNLGIFQVSVSPTAISAFNAFCMQAPLTVARGAMLASHQNCLRILATAQKTEDKQDYVRMAFSPVPLDIVTLYTPILM